MVNLHDFVTDSRAFRKFQFGELLFVEYHCVFDELSKGFWSPCNCLVYILRGQKKWKSLDREYIGRASEAIFMKKGAYIAEELIEEEFCSLLIFLPDDFIRSVIQSYSLKNSGKPVDINCSPILQINVNDILHAYFHSILSYFPQQKPPSKKLLKVKFEEFIINILSGTQNPALASYFEQISLTVKISIREIMEANFAFNMKLEEFARLSGRSLSAFQRDFKKEFGTSPGRWLAKRRLVFARLLLETTEKSINEVAFESGFENTSHFIRTFKRSHHHTPLQFRNSHRTSRVIEA